MPIYCSFVNRSPIKRAAKANDIKGCTRPKIAKFETAWPDIARLENNTPPNPKIANGIIHLLFFNSAGLYVKIWVKLPENQIIRKVSVKTVHSIIRENQRTPTFSNAIGNKGQVDQNNKESIAYKTPLLNFNLRKEESRFSKNQIAITNKTMLIICCEVIVSLYKKTENKIEPIIPMHVIIMVMPVRVWLNDLL